MQAKLRPGEHLEELFERAEAAGERDESLRELGHHRLALVHRGDDSKLGKSAMRHFLLAQRLGNHADDLAARRVSRPRQHAHHPHPAAAKDHAIAALHQLECQPFCGLRIVLARAATRTCKVRIFASYRSPLSLYRTRSTAASARA